MRWTIENKTADMTIDKTSECLFLKAFKINPLNMTSSYTGLTSNTVIRASILKLKSSLNVEVTTEEFLEKSNIWLIPKL